MSEEELESSSSEEEVEVAQNSGDRWFVAPEKLVELAVKPASRSATFEAQKNKDTELIFFTFPQNFDLKSLKGKSFDLPTEEHATVDLDGQFVCKGNGEHVDEPCVLAPAKTMEYAQVVALFPTGDGSGSAAKWMVGKPFSAGYSIAAAATLKAETSPSVEAATSASAGGDEPEVVVNKKGRTKVRVRKGAALTAVQEYGVGIKDAVLGEETEGNRTIDDVPLESLWSRWTAVGGTKRTREEQMRQQSRLQKKDKKNRKKKSKEEDHEEEEEAAAAAVEQVEEQEEGEVEEPKKKKSRKGKKHAE